MRVKDDLALVLSWPACGTLSCALRRPPANLRPATMTQTASPLTSSSQTPRTAAWRSSPSLTTVYFQDT
ncbi:hypothetical protein CesoFtcFv8_013326 [Champsocephalus esox]|uniref:Uncharacterized protein n=1 Tax=Champsocephalus esox TaxID=159716 RepID=A0AAN8GYS0_9TELE|nr:hypothetical protein CesoFtcFv8_013326 [Champsocephalus esox]